MTLWKCLVVVVYLCSNSSFSVESSQLPWFVLDGRYKNNFLTTLKESEHRILYVSLEQNFRWTISFCIWRVSVTKQNFINEGSQRTSNVYNEKLKTLWVWFVRLAKPLLLGEYNGVSDFRQPWAVTSFFKFLGEFFSIVRQNGVRQSKSGKICTQTSN